MIVSIDQSIPGIKQGGSPMLRRYVLCIFQAIVYTCTSAYIVYMYLVLFCHSGIL